MANPSNEMIGTCSRPQIFVKESVSCKAAFTPWSVSKRTFPPNSFSAYNNQTQKTVDMVLPLSSFGSPNSI